ncbi:MAG: hypothetical protein KAR57_09035 [Bacteroidales bacterium]|nr:hypothetical protein [Bacteroidales bacterium]
MKKLLSTLFISIFFSISLIGQNIGDSPQTKLGFTITINSQNLNDSVKLFVHYPFNYDSGKEFPLVLLLDANTSFKAFSACTELMAYEKSIPSCIVVGFPQYKYADFDNENIESKMDNLSKFFEKELLPYLQSKYNITKTIIWGQGSQSGLISSFMMIEYPYLFNGYISDVPDLSLMQERAYSEKAFDKLKDKKLNYYLFGNSAYNILNETFLNNLKANAPEGLSWNYAISDERNTIIYFLNNYMHATELFFKDKEE